MAYSRIKVWIPGEVLTANDLNAEFTGCVGNENDLLTRITNEATSRATADTTLQDNIDTIYDSTAGEIEANLVVEDSIKADAVTVAKIKDGEITLAKMAASAKSPAAGTEGLRKLGTGALDAMPGNTSLIPADGSVTEAKLGAGAVTVNKIGSSAVSQAKLKTSTGEVNTSSSSGEALTLPGGSYGFYPQVKSSSAGITVTAYIANSVIGSTYVASIYLKTSAQTAFATQRYVTSSGEVNWYFILRDKDTGEIVASYFAPDHPCFGNGGDPEKVPHPFPGYDPNKHEVVCINPDHSEIKAIAKRKGSKGILEVLQEEYVIDEQPAKWPTKAVTVGLSDEYDHVDDEKAIETIKMAIPHPGGVLCRTLRVK